MMESDTWCVVTRYCYVPIFPNLVVSKIYIYTSIANLGKWGASIYNMDRHTNAIAEEWLDKMTVNPYTISLKIIAIDGIFGKEKRH